jgi:hypothetical protein
MSLARAGRVVIISNNTSEPLSLMTADRYLSVIKTAIERDLIPDVQ